MTAAASDTAALFLFHFFARDWAVADILECSFSASLKVTFEIASEILPCSKKLAQRPLFQIEYTLCYPNKDLELGIFGAGRAGRAMAEWQGGCGVLF